MATIDLGKIKQVFRGTCNNATAYAVDDLVVFTDTNVTSTYICTTASTGNNPSSGGTAHANWAYVAKGVADPIPSQSGQSGKFLTTNGSALSFGTVSAGITEADQWRLTTNEAFSANSGRFGGGNNTILDANWERVDNNFEKIGTGLTESSGIFTFPSTGKYRVNYQLDGRSNNANSDYIGLEVALSTDSGSSFTGLTETSGTGVQPGGALVYWNVCTEVQFDVTNASTFRMRFEFFHQSNITLHGNSTRNTTCFNMIRLGDT